MIFAHFHNLKRMFSFLNMVAVLSIFSIGSSHAQEIPQNPGTGLKLDNQLIVTPSQKITNSTTRSVTAMQDIDSQSNDVIGEGDQILITVYGQPDLGADITVGESGVITLPLVGSLDVKDKTTLEIAKMFSNKLEQGQYLLDPKVSVKLIQQVSRSFSVLGEVVRPGRFQLKGNISLLDALSLAGGITQRAQKTLKVLRRNGQIKSNDLIEYASVNLAFDDLKIIDKSVQKVLPDDVIFIPAQKNFYVYGEVRKPGEYPIEDDLNVMRVLSIGGGITERGSSKRIVIYRKMKNGELKEIPASITDAVNPGDVVFINERIF